ncbi:cytochrome P450 [Nocardia noduli]|uniref:cytochrome P450 n=1 Tax=Nocardia noduli TaxID=2815722 RepID=UPI001C21C11A|nr:cytochrome P450 [Nocardia noduli]
MRHDYGPLVPVLLAPGVEATLVIGYRSAKTVLAQFPADPREWERLYPMPAGCPIAPMMQWRPNALRSAGSEHARYRSANIAALETVDRYRIEEKVHAAAGPLIRDLGRSGRADVVADYARPLASTMLDTLLGCTADLGERIARATSDMFESTDPVAAAKVNTSLAAALGELVALKSAHPADDVTSALLSHPARLSVEEVVQQLVTLYGAGGESMSNLMALTALQMLAPSSDSEYAKPATTIPYAIQKILIADPPLAIHCLTYPSSEVEIDGVLLPAHRPVAVSMAAANTDPATGYDSRSHTLSSRHLAWGSGPHKCPFAARFLAERIAEAGLTPLFDAWPEMALDIQPGQVRWRPGLFHRAPEVVPVTVSPLRSRPAHLRPARPCPPLPSLQQHSHTPPAVA